MTLQGYRPFVRVRPDICPRPPLRRRLFLSLRAPVAVGLYLLVSVAQVIIPAVLLAAAVKILLFM